MNFRAPERERERERERDRERAAQSGGGSGDAAVERTNDFVSIKQQLACMKDEDALCFFLSHTRVVVRECCKGGDASQWENGKFDPLPPPNSFTIVTKNCARD